MERNTAVAEHEGVRRFAEAFPRHDHVQGHTCGDGVCGDACHTRVLVAGDWTHKQTSGGVGDVYANSTQYKLAHVLAAFLLVVLVCEWGTSSRCVWCALYGKHGGDVEKIRLTKVYRQYSKLKLRQERVLHCTHCGRYWNRDEHGALAIRVNALWYMKYGVYHPMFRPPYSCVGKDLGPDGKPNLHQMEPVELRP